MPGAGYLPKPDEARPGALADDCGRNKPQYDDPGLRAATRAFCSLILGNSHISSFSRFAISGVGLEQPVVEGCE
jgi:hypothetical protein